MLCDLHAHITGSLDAESLFDIILESNIHKTYDLYLNKTGSLIGIKELAYRIANNPDDAKRLFINVYPCLPNGENRFDEIMSRFIFLNFIIRIIPNSKKQIGKIVANKFKEQGVDYVEWRLDPLSGTENYNAKEGIEKIYDYFSGLSESSLNSKIVLGIGRHQFVYQSKIDYIFEQFKIILKTCRDIPIVALDAVNKETVSIKNISKILLLAKDYGLDIVPHAGELSSETIDENIQNVMDAIELGSKRIGHAIVAYGNFDSIRNEQHDLLQRIHDSGVVIEVCPTSNLSAHIEKTSYAEHPITRLVEYDIPFVVCTDDYGIFGRTLNEEIDGLCKAHNLDKDLIIKNNERFRLG